MGLISRALGVQNIEITTSSQLDAALRKGSPTWAGMDVNANNALTVSTVFACRRLISEDIGKLSYPIYQRKNDGDRKRMPSSPWWTLVHDRPNSWQTSQQFREQLTGDALMRGDGFALKNIVHGQVRELLPLDPRNVRIEQLDDFEVVYHVRIDNKTETLTRRDVFHVMGVSLNGYSGVSIVTLARQSISTAMALERHAGTVFGNGLNPGGVYTTPGILPDEAFKRLNDSLLDDHSGDNSNAPLLLENGTTWKQTGLSNEDGQFLESRKFSVEEIARWFRVPPHKVGHLEQSTNNNIEHQAIEYQQDTLLSWAKRWDNAFNGQVITGDGVFAELNLDSLLQADTKAQHEAMRISVGGPWLARNEARALLNLPRIDDPAMDKVITPLAVSVESEERERTKEPAA